MTRRFILSQEKSFQVSMVKRDRNLHQTITVLWVDGTTLRRSITESITNDQTLPREEWMRKSMVSSLTHFHLST